MNYLSILRFKNSELFEMTSFLANNVLNSMQCVTVNNSAGHLNMMQFNFNIETKTLQRYTLKSKL